MLFDFQAKSSPESAAAPQPVERGHTTLVSSGIQAITRDAPSPTLVALTGAERGRVYRVDDSRGTMGRLQDAMVQIDDESVSRRHAELVMVAGSVFIRDLGSTNGTMVNGRPVPPAGQQLNEGDRVQLGDAVFKFALQDDLEADAQVALYTAASRDALTRALNRRCFLERLEQELAFARRHGTTLALAVFDLDHFKRINDSMGHVAGDTVLRHFAAYIANHIRSEDVFARYGGEEFVLLMREVGPEGARIAVERLREGVAAERIDIQGFDVRVTMSCGIAGASPGDATSPTALLERADKMLYAAKSAGRNCTRVAGAGPVTTDDRRTA